CSASAWRARYQTSPYHREFVSVRAGKQSQKHEISTSRPAQLLPSVKQWWTLVKRCMAIKAKDSWNTAILLAQVPIVAALVVAVFGVKCRTPMAGENSLQVAGSLAIVIFLLGLSALWFGCSNAVREIVGERAIYQ